MRRRHLSCCPSPTSFAARGDATSGRDRVHRRGGCRRRPPSLPRDRLIARDCSGPYSKCYARNDCAPQYDLIASVFGPAFGFLKRRLCLHQITRFGESDPQFWEEIEPAHVIQPEEIGSPREEVDGGGYDRRVPRRESRPDARRWAASIPEPSSLGATSEFDVISMRLLKVVSEDLLVCRSLCQQPCARATPRNVRATPLEAVLEQPHRLRPGSGCDRNGIRRRPRKAMRPTV